MPRHLIETDGLDALADVQIGVPPDGTVLTYNDSLGRWVPGVGGGGGGGGGGGSQWIVLGVWEHAEEGNASQIDFTQIPGVYDDLLLEATLVTNRSSGSGIDRVYAQFGGTELDIGSNYGWAERYVGTSTTENNATSDTAMQVLWTANADSTGEHVFGRALIRNYASTEAWRMMLGESMSLWSGGRYRVHHWGTWFNDATRIEQIRLLPDDGTEFTGGRVVLYGVRHEGIALSGPNPSLLEQVVTTEPDQAVALAIPSELRRVRLEIIAPRRGDTTDWRIGFRFNGDDDDTGNYVRRNWSEVTSTFSSTIGMVRTGASSADSPQMYDLELYQPSDDLPMYWFGRRLTNDQIDFFTGRWRRGSGERLEAVSIISDGGGLPSGTIVRLMNPYVTVLHAAVETTQLRQSRVGLTAAPLTGTNLSDQEAIWTRVTAFADLTVSRVRVAVHAAGDRVRIRVLEVDPPTGNSTVVDVVEETIYVTADPPEMVSWEGLAIQLEADKTYAFVCELETGANLSLYHSRTHLGQNDLISPNDLGGSTVRNVGESSSLSQYSSSLPIMWFTYTVD